MKPYLLFLSRGQPVLVHGVGELVHEDVVMVMVGVAGRAHDVVQQHEGQ